MLDTETRQEILRIVQETVQSVQNADATSRVADAVDNLRIAIIDHYSPGCGADVRGGSSGPVGDGPFSPVYDDSESSSSSSSGDTPQTVIGFENCYYQVGGKTYQMSDWSGLPIANGFVALRINASSSAPGATLVGYATLAALQAAQANLQYLVYPLYLMSSSTIALDMRRTPFIQLAEVF